MKLKDSPLSEEVIFFLPLDQGCQQSAFRIVVIDDHDGFCHSAHLRIQSPSLMGFETVCNIRSDGKIEGLVIEGQTCQNVCLDETDGLIFGFFFRDAQHIFGRIDAGDFEAFFTKDCA